MLAERIRAYIGRLDQRVSRNVEQCERHRKAGEHHYAERAQERADILLAVAIELRYALR